MTNQIAQQLQAAIQDNARFDAIIETLRADRTIRVIEMREIAAAFLGFEIKKSKGRAAALLMIIERQRVAARQAARGRVIDRELTW